mmetsp:Transcript_28079/g.48942  ORF Transcript_28079/g.48942 Transcript_28079/m.48942 type:complete len:230 (+) Transcript_28079:72-761(+)
MSHAFKMDTSPSRRSVFVIASMFLVVGADSDVCATTSSCSACVAYSACVWHEESCTQETEVDSNDNDIIKYPNECPGYDDVCGQQDSCLSCQNTRLSNGATCAAWGDDGKCYEIYQQMVDAGVTTMHAFPTPGCPAESVESEEEESESSVALIIGICGGAAAALVLLVVAGWITVRRRSRAENSNPARPKAVVVQAGVVQAEVVQAEVVTGNEVNENPRVEVPLANVVI